MCYFPKAHGVPPIIYQFIQEITLETLIPLKKYQRSPAVCTIQSPILLRHLLALTP